MNTSSIIQQRPSRLFDLAVYLTLAVLMAVSLIVFPSALVRAQIIALCSVFGLIYRFGYYAIRTPRHAAIYFCIQTLVLLGLIMLARTSDVFGLLFFTLGIQAVLTWGSRTAIAWIVLFYLIDTSGALLYRGPEGIVNVLFNAAVFVLTFVFANSLRQTEIARDQNQQLLEDLRAAQRQVQDLAVAEERNRLARELHDSVKQQVFATIMQLGAARVLLERDPDAARVHLLEAEQLAQQSGAELSLLIHELRPVALGDKGLAAATAAHDRAKNAAHDRGAGTARGALGHEVDETVVTSAARSGGTKDQRAESRESAAHDRGASDGGRGARGSALHWSSRRASLRSGRARSLRARLKHLER